MSEPIVRSSESTAKLCAALVRAQKAAIGVPKDDKNEHFGFKYPKSETIIAEAKVYLGEEGLAAFPISCEEILPRPEYGEAEKKAFHVARATMCRYYFKVVHSSGEWEVHGPRDYPVTPEKGALRAAWAASDTLVLAYFFRDLLAMPKLSKEEFQALEAQSAREKEEAAKEAARLKPEEPKRVEAPAVLAPPSGDGRVKCPHGTFAMGACAECVAPTRVKLTVRAADLATGATPAATFSIGDAPAAPCNAKLAKVEGTLVNTGTGEVIDPAKEAERSTLREEIGAAFDASVQKREAQLLATDAAVVAEATPPPTTAAPASVGASAPSGTQPASTPGDDALRARRTSMLRTLVDARKAALAAGVSADEFKRRVNEVVPGLHGDGRFVSEVLTDSALKALSAVGVVATLAAKAPLATAK